MYTPEQLHSDVIRQELGEDKLTELIPQLTDDEAWVVISTLNSEVLTLEQLDTFLRMGYSFRNDDTGTDSQYREVKVFRRQYYGLELRLKKTREELINAVISHEELRRRTVNREEAQRMAEEATDQNF
jgi:hypothetical protein